MVDDSQSAKDYVAPELGSHDDWNDTNLEEAELIRRVSPGGPVSHCSPPPSGSNNQRSNDEGLDLADI